MNMPGPGVQSYPLGCHVTGWPNQCDNAAIGRDGKNRLACAEHGALDIVTVMDARIDWAVGWANSPTLQLYLNRIPAHEDFVYTRKEWCYYAEYQGVVRFYSYRSPGNGYGGSAFHLRMEDGTTETLHGPWASGAYAVNKLGLGPVVDACYTDKAEAFQRGRTFLAGAVTLDLALNACRIMQGMSLLWVGSKLIPFKVSGLTRVYGTMNADEFGSDTLTSEQRIVAQS